MIPKTIRKLNVKLSRLILTLTVSQGDKSPRGKKKKKNQPQIPSKPA